MKSQNFRAEWELSEKAHDKTIEQLMRTQQERNKWKEMTEKLVEEMLKAEWVSPIYFEAKELLNGKPNDKTSVATDAK